MNSTPSVILCAVCCGCIALSLSLFNSCAQAPAVDIEVQKKIAAELRNNSLFQQAREEYARLVTSPGLTSPQRGALAYLVAEICYTDTRQYADAAAWYLKAREYDPNADYISDLNQKLVASLEKSGRMIDAQQALEEVTSPDTTTRSAEDKVVATFGQRSIYRSDVERTIQELPRELQQQLSSPERRVAYLRQYVGVELLYEAASREQLDKSESFARRREQAVKRLLVDEYVSSKLAMPDGLDSSDVMNFYTANKSQFGDRAFSEVRNDVIQAYQSQKMESAYNELVSSLAEAQKLKINDENMR